MRAAPSNAVGLTRQADRQILGTGGCVVLSLADFRLTRSRSLSIGGWQPSRRRWRFHFLVCRGRRWPSSGVGFAATGLRRAGEGCVVLSLADFRLTRSRSLSIGGWQPSRRRWRFSNNRKKNKATAKTNRLCSTLSRRVRFQKNVYASAIGLCKGLLCYAVKETVEPGLLRSFNV